MSTRRLPARAAIAVLMGALVGCSSVTGVEFDVPVTPPPGEAPVFAATEVVPVEGIPAGNGTLSAVATGPGGVVAVGRLGLHLPVSPPIVVLSQDGRSWERVGPEQGFDLVDVAASADAFVAVGSRVPPEGQAVRSAFLVSPDGRTWEALDGAAYGGAEAYVAQVAAGPGGFRATGNLASDGRRVSWTSADGRSWTVDADPIWLAAAAPEVWVEARGAEVRITRDGAEPGPWTRLEEPRGDETILHFDAIVIGRAGMLVVGAVGTGCGPFGSCASRQRGWWSEDGVEWRILPIGDPGWSGERVNALSATADGTIVTAANFGPLATHDGWRWTALLPQGVLGGTVYDMAAINDGLVLVGDAPWPAAATAPWAAIVVLAGGG